MQDKFDGLFHGTLPQTYQQYMVPLFFEGYAAKMTARVAQRRPASLLEIAAGTGVVTRQLASALPASMTIVASDLVQSMLDEAIAQGASRPVEWRQADAMKLPFADESFDAVVCQFGVMFFPDKAKAFSEVRRVLRAGGVFFFSVWDSIEENEFDDVVVKALAKRYPHDPPSFAVRIPHGYYDLDRIAGDLAQGGFKLHAVFSTLPAISRAASPDLPAFAICKGTPMRDEIVARDPDGLDDAARAAAQAIEERFGAGVVEGRMQAHFVVVER